MAKSKKFNGVLTTFLCVIIFCLCFVGTGYGYLYLTSQKEINNIKVYVDGSISFHFLELGNKYSGDCTYIKAGNIDILIDAGSKVSSIPTIQGYLNNYVLDNKLEFVIVTHAHEDHYAGFAGNATTDSLFDLFVVETIIDFSNTNKTYGGTDKMYNRYIDEVNAEVGNGAKHYTALDCVNKTNGAETTFQLDAGITMTILNQEYYTTTFEGDENNYSVCTLFTHGDRNFLFTGDLEKEGELSLVGLNNLPKCDLYKAGHHGSYTSSTNELLNVIQPDIVCVCCCAGNYEHAKKNENNFPSQTFVNNVAPHTKQVYVTTIGILEAVVEDGETSYDCIGYESMNGNIVVTSKSTTVEVNCSNNNTLLKDTKWFKENRELPNAWAS